MFKFDYVVKLLISIECDSYTKHIAFWTAQCSVIDQPRFTFCLQKFLRGMCKQSSICQFKY